MFPVARYVRCSEVHKSISEPDGISFCGSAKGYLASLSQVNRQES